MFWGQKIKFELMYLGRRMHARSFHGGLTLMKGPNFFTPWRFLNIEVFLSVSMLLLNTKNE